MRRGTFRDPFRRRAAHRTAARRARARRHAARRGVQTLELILVLPILVIATLAIFQFGMLAAAQQGVTHAAITGAREAAKRTDIVTVRDTVDAILTPYDIAISNAPGSGTKVMLEDGLNPPVEYGDPLLDCYANGPALVAGEVRVTVCILTSVAKVPDALSTFGFSLAGRRFEISSVTRKE
jgi:hypothetical protein